MPSISLSKRQPSSSAASRLPSSLLAKLWRPSTSTLQRFTRSHKKKRSKPGNNSNNKCDYAINDRSVGEPNKAAVASPVTVVADNSESPAISLLEQQGATTPNITSTSSDVSAVVVASQKYATSNDAILVGNEEKHVASPFSAAAVGSPPGSINSTSSGTSSDKDVLRVMEKNITVEPITEKVAT